MSQIVNKSLSAGDKFMPEISSYLLVDHLLKNKERRQKFKETGNSRYIYPIKLVQACF